jgi:hypothetical protein
VPSVDKRSGTSGRVAKLVALRLKDDDGEREAVYLVLEREVPVDGQERVELALGERQQFTIPSARPAHLGDCASVVPSEVALEAPRQALIKQNAHGRRGRL